MAIHVIRSVAVLSILLGGVFPLAGAPEGKAGAVEFVVGGYLKAEGGDWDAKQGPLTKSFGIDFDSAGAMYVVEQWSLQRGRKGVRKGVGPGKQRFVISNSTPTNPMPGSGVRGPRKSTKTTCPNPTPRSSTSSTR